MPALKLSTLFRRDADRPKLKQRAADLKARLSHIGAPKAAPPLLPDTHLIDRVELAAASLNELRVIQEKTRHLSDVAYAMSSQGCCEHNAAGDLMLWLAEELTTVESRAADELQRRRPDDFEDRKARLAAVAERIIYNGDDDETAAFVRDLAAFAAEQARG